MDTAMLDNKKLLQILILSLLEDDGLTVHEVIKLLNMTAIGVAQGLKEEESKSREEKA
jgi:hypothetical protein